MTAGSASIPIPLYGAAVLLAVHLSTDHEVLGGLDAAIAGGVRPILLGHTLDLDSTVSCRYGEQAGSLKGHNPIKHGRPSHHPLVAWSSERRQL